MTQSSGASTLLDEVRVFDDVVDVVTIVGPDAESYLQGQLSQDVLSLGAGHSAWTLLLNPNGKMAAFGVVSRRSNDRFVLVVDALAGDEVAERLNRFKLRVKADVEVRSNAPATRVCGTLAASLVEHLHSVGDDSSFLVDASWRSWSHFIVVGERPDEFGGSIRTERSLYEGCRICAGLPVWGAELSSNTIAEEAFLVDASVSFTKGCYTGQELVARIDSRGRNVPRRLRLIRAGNSALPAVGNDVLVDGQSVGVLTSVAQFVLPDGSNSVVAMAMLARSVEPPTRGVAITANGAIPLTIEAGWEA
jgi:folate-binding protein YgfZ